jgi:hypothetical protein
MATRMRSLDDMSAMFDLLTDLAPQQRATIKQRYRFLMAEYRRRCRFYTILFYMLRSTITVGSLAVPGLLSLSVPPESQDLLRWLTWSISLAVTTANGLVTLFKVDKRFFMMHAVAESLRTETWQYLSLAGRYSGHQGGFPPTHVNQYVIYTTRLERIRMRHIDEEYTRQAEEAQDEKKEGSAVSSQSTMGGNKLVLSPAPQAPLQNTQNQKHRRESESTVGSNDEVSVSSSGGSAVPGGGDTRASVLPAASGLPSITIVELGTPVSSQQVQSEQARPGVA